MHSISKTTKRNFLILSKDGVSLISKKAQRKEKNNKIRKRNTISRNSKLFSWIKLKNNLRDAIKTKRTIIKMCLIFLISKRLPNRQIPLREIITRPVPPANFCRMLFAASAPTERIVVRRIRQVQGIAVRIAGNRLI